MKTNRQMKILKLISEQEIETQEDLLRQLQLNGYKTTQATVSRDIRELGIVKVATDHDTYMYHKPQSSKEPAVSAKFSNIIRETVISVACASNIAVVKTYAGMAPAAAAAIDSFGWADIIGSLAGDDTIFVAMADKESADNFSGRLKRILAQKNDGGDF